MIKNLFKRKPSLDLVNTHEADVALRLMFEIAISDGKLDSAELDIIKERANKIASKDEKASAIVKKIIEEHNGTISIENFMGTDEFNFKGTKVIINLPALSMKG